MEAERKRNLASNLPALGSYSAGVNNAQLQTDGQTPAKEHLPAGNQRIARARKWLRNHNVAIFGPWGNWAPEHLEKHYHDLGLIMEFIEDEAEEFRDEAASAARLQQNSLGGARRA